MSIRGTQQAVAAKARELLAGRVQAAVELSAAGDLVDDRQEEVRVAQEALSAARAAYDARYAGALREHGWSPGELAELGSRPSGRARQGGQRRSRGGNRAAAPASGPGPDQREAMSGPNEPTTLHESARVEGAGLSTSA